MAVDAESPEQAEPEQVEPVLEPSLPIYGWFDAPARRAEESDPATIRARLRAGRQSSAKTSNTT